ncbi:MAG: putative Holliday junction resolvase [Planctomycetota bacterium]
MRYLAIDLGDKRTGFAAGDDVVGLVQPLFVAEAGTQALQLKAAMKAIDEYGPDRIVLGLPYNMDGTEGPRAKLVRAFAEELGRRLREEYGAHTRMKVEFHDERLSSFAAEERLKRTGRTHGEKKALRDALAACAILEDFLAVQRGTEHDPGDDEADDAGDAS